MAEGVGNDSRQAGPVSKAPNHLEFSLAYAAGYAVGRLTGGQPLWLQSERQFSSSGCPQDLPRHKRLTEDRVNRLLWEGGGSIRSE